jgi:hypothetical protein
MIQITAQMRVLLATEPVEGQPVEGRKGSIPWRSSAKRSWRKIQLDMLAGNLRPVEGYFVGVLV